MLRIQFLMSEKSDKPGWYEDSQETFKKWKILENQSKSSNNPINQEKQIKENYDKGEKFTVERWFIGNIIDQQNSHGSTIISCRQNENS
jgi:hypothetical protein